MPTTILQSFNKLRSNLEITTLQESTVSTRQQSVKAALEKGLDILDTFLTGSYKRNTMIAPLYTADIDIFIVLDPKYYANDGQTSLLDRVRRTLLKRYPNTPRVSRNGQAVTIIFKDFQVDVVPSFYRTGGGYLIPDSISKRWIDTDPKKHVDLWSNENKKHAGNLVPIIKMIKAWNKKHSGLLRSFHLEALVLAILQNVPINDFSSGVRYVFDKARTYIKGPLLDPAGYGGDLSEYLNRSITGKDIARFLLLSESIPNKRKEVLERLEKAYKTSCEAEQYAATGKIIPAIAKWRVIFGDYLPSYN